MAWRKVTAATAVTTEDADVTTAVAGVGEASRMTPVTITGLDHHLREMTVGTNDVTTTAHRTLNAISVRPHVTRVRTDQSWVLRR